MTAFNRQMGGEYRAPGQPDLQASATSEMPRRNPMQVIWQRRWFVILTTILTVGASVFYIFQATPMYRSGAQLYVYQKAPTMLQSDGGNGLVMGNTNYLYTQQAVIQSRAVLDTVAQNPEIAALKSFEGKSHDQIYAFLRTNVVANPNRQNDLIQVIVKAPQSEDAARIATEVVDAYQKYQAKTTSQTTSRLQNLLIAQRDLFKKDLEAKQKALTEFLTENAKYTLKQQSNNPIYIRLDTLSAELTRAQIEHLRGQSALDAATAMQKDSERMAQFVNQRMFRGETADLRRELRELQSKMVLLAATYDPKSPMLGPVLANLQTLKEEIGKENQNIVAAYLTSLAQEVDTAQDNEARLQQFVNEQTAKVMDFNKASAEYSGKEIEIASIAKEKEALDIRINELALLNSGDSDTGVGSMTIRVVEPPMPERLPVEPDKTYSLFVGLASGLLIGTVLAFVRDWLDQRLRSADEIKQVTQLPVLGVIPHIVNAKLLAQRGQALHKDPMSDVAEAYRTVRTAVYFGSPNGAAKTMLVTSPAPGDGKSTLASNLAIAMAQAGNKVLLLDCDFRKPTQHKIFDLDRPVGLSNVLAGEKDLQEALHETGVPGLSLLPCGPIPANPAEILNSQTFADVLEQLKEQFDQVVLDSPPVMPVTDARILAASADATVLALRAEKSTRKAAVFSRDTLQAVGANLIGVVVNDVPRKKGIYGYYYAYGEAYQYGYGAKRGNAAGANNGARTNGTAGRRTAAAAVDAPVEEEVVEMP